MKLNCSSMNVSMKAVAGVDEPGRLVQWVINMRHSGQQPEWESKRIDERKGQEGKEKANK